MNIAAAVLLVAVVTAVTVGSLLLVRRGAPRGSYFADGDRAAGVFGVIATGFAVLLGFVVFLAFESYDSSRSGAEQEARVVVQQFETAQFLPAAAVAPLSGELICYARWVARDEWGRLASGTEGNTISPWSEAMFRSLRAVEPRLASEQAAYAKWLDQTSERENARADRTHAAAGVIPPRMWGVLLLSAAVIFAYMLLFADSGERWFVQATLIGAVTIVLTSTLSLLWFLDHPYHRSFGSLQPVAMERAIGLLEQASVIVGNDFAVPCDQRGLPRS